MTVVLSYLNYNWAELLLVIGMLLLLRTDVYSDKRMTQNVKVLLYPTVN